MPRSGSSKSKSRSNRYNLRSHPVSTNTETMVSFTDNQFAELMQRLNLGGTAPPPPREGNFSNCSARFTAADTDDVDAFIDAVETFKSCSRVSDDNALKGLSMLVEGTAAVWWQGIKPTVTTWPAAVCALRASFSRRLPPHLLFREIFKREQTNGETTDLFVSRVRALFAQLPYALPERAQVDMVYGLLRAELRQRIKPQDTFQVLLEEARDVEISFRESAFASPRTSVSDARREVKNENSRVSRVQCVYCKARGHTRDNCDRLRKKTSAVNSLPANSAGNSSRNERQIVCFGCGAPNVLRSNCSRCKTKSAEDRTTLNLLTLHQLSAPETTSDSKLLLPIEIGDLRTEGYADTGAQVSVAGANLFKLLQDAGHAFTPRRRRLSFADGKVRTEDVLQVLVDVTIAGRIVPTNFVVFPRSQHSQTLLGVDFLTNADIILDVPRKQWYFRENSVSPRPHEDVVLPLTEESESPADVTSCCELSLRQEEGEDLGSEQRNKLNSLLAHYETIFEPGGEPTDFAVHRIKVTDKNPISSPPYPVNGPKKEFLRKELDSLLEQGIIEECESPWASPVVLVPKHDGSYRLCVDFRRLNAVTVSDTYPMPRIEDLLHTAKRTPFMSTLDLQSGFWQVPVAEEDRDKTCFVTSLGTYRFTRMPFGLRNSPATFVRLMDRFRAGLGDRSVFAYLDDILVLSESFEQHLEDLDAVFKRLCVFKLRARRDKCVFVRKSIKYLGHVIAPDGIRVDPEKTAAIQEMNPPTCVKDVLSFVQTCSWYRKFIPNFSEIARPLTDLTKKGRKFRFEEKEREAFTALKLKLTSPPVLIQADQSKPYVLRTDASGFALGAVLLQGESRKEEQPIEFASRLLNIAERNYSTTEREALAVVWAVEKFRTYLEGSEVTIATDHQPLQWLLSLKTPSGRLARWALRIQGLNMRIIYEPGKSNVVADTLSRPFPISTNDEVKDVCYVTIEFPTVSCEDYRGKQMADEEVKKIISGLEGADAVETLRWTERGYVMSNGVLYRFHPDATLEDPQLVVPRALRNELLKYYHDAPTAGHYGVDRTYAKVASKFYFSGMRRFIAEYVKSCIECQKYKPKNLKPAGLLQTPAPAQRFEVLAVDFFGPLPATAIGNKWILMVEDLASRWMEIFALKEATAEATAKVLIEEIFLRYGTPRKIVSDNGVQFVSAVMQKVTFCFGIEMPFIPAYHPESNPVERKNRDLKTQLSILVGNRHDTWDEHIASIRFAMNSTVCETLGQTPAYLTFGRQLRAPHDAAHDLRKVVNAENFVPRITPYLQVLSSVLCEAHEVMTKQQDRHKEIVDSKRQPAEFKEGDLVLLKSHSLSNSSKKKTSKFAPKRDGPYLVSKVASPTTYQLSSRFAPYNDIGRYHASDLTLFQVPEGEEAVPPIVPVRRRGRPRKTVLPAAGVRCCGQRGSV